MNQVKTDGKTIQVRCKRCNHTWNYSGTNKWVVTCPRCRRILNLKSNMLDKRSTLSNKNSPIHAVENMTDNNKIPKNKDFSDWYDTTYTQTGNPFSDIGLQIAIITDLTDLRKKIEDLQHLFDSTKE